MGGKTKRKLSDWNKFVMKVKAENPEKAFGDVLKLAGKMKRQGVKIGDYINNKTMKAVKKIKNSATTVVKRCVKLARNLSETEKNESQNIQEALN